MRSRVTGRLRVGLWPLLVGGLLAACGAAQAPNTTPRGAIMAFNADLDAADYAGACSLMEQVARTTFIVQVPHPAKRAVACAAALRYAEAHGQLRGSRMPAAEVRHADVNITRDGTFALVHASAPETAIYLVGLQHGLWLIATL
jgi:hypothetical protein